MGFVAQDRPRPQWDHGAAAYGMDVAAHTWPITGTTFICLATRDMACNRLITAWHFWQDGPLDCGLNAFSRRDGSKALTAPMPASASP